MKKTLLTMAFAALLGVGSAWAEATTIYERGLDTAWSDGDLADWTLSGTAESSIVTTGLQFAKTAAGATEYTYTKTLTTSDNAVVSMNLVWNVANANGSSTAGCYFILGDVKLFWCGQDRNLNITIGGTETALMSSASKSLRGSTFNVDLTINKATKAVSYSISNSQYSSGTPIEGTGIVVSSDITNVVFGWARGGQKNTSSQIINSIKITEETQAVTPADYTINYNYNDATIKTVNGSGVVGAEITADVAVDGEGDYEGNHYLIEAKEAPSMTLVDGENVLNVPVRTPYTATLSLTTSIAGVAGEPVVTTFTETDDKVCTWSYAYPYYVEKDGVYYVVAADVTTSFGESGTFVDGEKITKSVSYTNVDSSVVYFKEAEKVAGTNPAYSNGNTGYVASQNERNRGFSVGTLPAGTYQFIAKITNANRRSLVIRQSTNDPIASVGTSNEDKTIGVKSAEFTLVNETSNLWVNGANSGTDKTNQSEDFDYVVIKRVGDLTAYTGTFSSVGYATISSSYALDFSGVEGLKAYTVSSVADGVATLSEVTGAVPAETGLILAGEAGATYSIPVVAEADAVGDNYLVANLTDYELPWETDGKYNYILAVDGEDVGFFPTSGVGTLAAGKAYLQTTYNAKTAQGKSGIKFVFDDLEEDEAGNQTGIEQIEAAAGKQVIYDLQGRIVKEMTSGLYIVNGKKVWVK